MPWPQYQLALRADTTSSYRQFYERFPNSKYAEDARERRQEKLEFLAWELAQADDTLESYDMYLKAFPDGHHFLEARRHHNAFIDQLWVKAAATRDPATIGQFAEQYPDSDLAVQAQNLIETLHHDWDWVRAQDTIAIYRRFLENDLDHPEAAWIETRIIELEIKRIASGTHGTLPASIPRLSTPGSATAKIDIHNATLYPLTVLYSGPEAHRILLRPGQTTSVVLPVGRYQVAASVESANVQGYYGIERLEGGEYDNRFYIREDLLNYPGFYIP